MDYKTQLRKSKGILNLDKIKLFIYDDGLNLKIVKDMFKLKNKKDFDKLSEIIKEDHPCIIKDESEDIFIERIKVICSQNPFSYEEDEKFTECKLSESMLN